MCSTQNMQQQIHSMLPDPKDEPRRKEKTKNSLYAHDLRLATHCKIFSNLSGSLMIFILFIFFLSVLH